MRSFHFSVCLFLSFLSWTNIEAARTKNSDLDTKSSVGGSDNDGETSTNMIIEENPDYVAPENDSFDMDVDTSDFDSDSDSDSSDSNDDDDEEGDDGAKRQLSKRLKKTKKTRTRPFKILKKNKLRITMVLALYAFRREILLALFKLSRIILSEGNTTDILKLILFFNFMRKILFVLNPGGGGDLGSLMNSIGSIMNSNPAFVPPITQHFAFER